MVGYGTDASEGDYWTLRNSWGPNWGEDGFIRLKRESTGKALTTLTLKKLEDFKKLCTLLGIYKL